jgi:Family of unknown function (DUF6178)
MAKRVSRRRRGTHNTRRAARSIRTVPSVRSADPAPHDTGSVHDRLARLLDTPLLARVVPHLPPETLHQIIRYRGLDACGELVAAATPEQLTSVLDLDLWPSAQRGRGERFDDGRFGEWLELLVDTGESVAAWTVAAIDQNLVIAGLSRHMRVLDPATFAPSASNDDASMDVDATPFDGLEGEVGGYVVRAKRTDAWDAIVTLLLALDADHRDYLHTVMQGCRRLSNSTPEIDGLDNLLMEPEQQLHDVALEREHRRSRLGYSTPADARAFLQMARQPRHQRPNAPPSINPIAAAYFRAADEAVASADLNARPQERALEPSTRANVSESIDAVVDLLTEAGLIPERPRALLQGTGPQPSRLTQMRPLMAYLRDRDHTAYLTRSRELAFLANTLMAGCSVQSRAFTAREASDAAVGICNLGLEHWPARWPDAETHVAASRADLGTTLPDTFLLDHDLVMAFEVGWAVLHEDVSMFVAEHLIVTLKDLRCVDAEIQSGLHALRHELVRQHDAGTPWRARDTLDVLAMLDMPAWVSVLGLLDECPVLPAAVTAILEGRTRAVSATAFEFISTTGQIREVRAFMARLLDVLHR